MYTEFGDPKSIMVEFHFLRPLKGKKKPPKTTFSIFFLHISFSIATEAMYTEFGDPKSIMVEFHFSRPKKPLKRPFKKAENVKMTFFKNPKKCF